MCIRDRHDAAGRREHRPDGHELHSDLPDGSRDRAGHGRDRLLLHVEGGRQDVYKRQGQPPSLCSTTTWPSASIGASWIAACTSRMMFPLSLIHICYDSDVRLPHFVQAKRRIQPRRAASDDDRVIPPENDALFCLLFFHILTIYRRRM